MIAQNFLPLPGKWNTGNPTDFVGIWNKSKNRAFLSGTSAGTVNSISSIIGLSGDVALSIDFAHGTGDEIALYRPSTRKLIFYPANTQNDLYERVVGNPGNKIISGNWDGVGKDGFAVYMPDVNQFWFYQNYDSPDPMGQVIVGNENDIPLSGDWNGDGRDGYAVYNPGTNDIWFFQNYYDSDPFDHVVVPHAGTPITGDWNGDGKDGYGILKSLGDTDGDGLANFSFVLYNRDATGPATQTVFWEDINFTDISSGRQNFNNYGVPHTDIDGNKLMDYNAATSFLPKGIYSAIGDNLQEVYDAGFNLAFLWDPEYYPLSPAAMTTMDATGNKMKTILYFRKHGGRPFIGKFNDGNKDLVGISGLTTNLVAYDNTGDNIPDKQFRTGNQDDGHIHFAGNWQGSVGPGGYALFTPPVAPSTNNTIHFFDKLTEWWQPTPANPIPLNPDWGSIPFKGDWNGDGKDSYGLRNPLTRRIYYFPTYTAPSPTYVIQVGDEDDIVISGNWDGIGGDGYALYRPSTGEFWFYQNYFDTDPFNRIVFGSFGDTPISGDWNGDGKDGIGVYHTTPQHEKHEFWMADNIFGSMQVTYAVFGNPLTTLTPKKYVYGIYAADEPSLHPTVYTVPDLGAIYTTYSPLSTHVFFHADDRDDAVGTDNYNRWLSYRWLGEAVAIDGYPVKKDPNLVTTIGSVAVDVEASRLAANDTRPTWYVSQIFKQFINEYNDFWMPQPIQFRAMVYTALIHGATGIFDFAYHNDIFNDPHNTTHHLFGITRTSYPDQWDMAKAVNEELEILKPFLLSKTPHPNDTRLSVFVHQPLSIEEPLPIRTLLKKNPNGDYILMAVNMTRQPLSATITLPKNLCPTNRKVVKLFPNTNISVNAGGINDSFTNFGVNIYKIEAATLPAPGNGRTATEEFVANEVENIKEIEPNEETIFVYPNPSSSVFKFNAHTKGNVKISIYDTNGKIVKFLESAPNSDSEIVWNCDDEIGNKIKAGIYFYHLITSNAKTFRGKIIFSPSK